MMKLCGILRSSAILGSDSPQSNNRKDNSLWVTPFIPRGRPNVKHAIAGYLGLPQPTSAPLLSGGTRVRHWQSARRLWPDTRRLQLLLDDCCRLVLPYNDVHSIQQTKQIPNDPPRMGAKSTTTSNHPSTPPGACKLFPAKASWWDQPPHAGVSIWSAALPLTSFWPSVQLHTLYQQHRNKLSDFSRG